MTRRLRRTTAEHRQVPRTSDGDRQFTAKWYTSGKGPAEKDKEFASSTELRRIISEQLGTRLSKNCGLYLADTEYYCTPLEDAREIIKQSSIDRNEWVQDRMDCDDFALILKAHFAQASYKKGNRRPPHCFGIVWEYYRRQPHALNWMVNSDRRLRLVEPQTDEIFAPRPDDKDMYFMLG